MHISSLNNNANYMITSLNMDLMILRYRSQAIVANSGLIFKVPLSDTFCLHCSTLVDSFVAMISKFMHKILLKFEYTS